MEVSVVELVAEMDGVGKIKEKMVFGNAIQQEALLWLKNLSILCCNYALLHFYGDNVPKDRANIAMEAAKGFDAFLLLSSSVMTMCSIGFKCGISYQPPTTVPAGWSGLRGGLGGAAVDVIVVVGSGDAEVSLDMMDRYRGDLSDIKKLCGVARGLSCDWWKMRIAKATKNTKIRIVRCCFKKASVRYFIVDGGGGFSIFVVKSLDKGNE
ncbi:hypothetical protein Tco_0855243 [Tanacetum coccineum]